ncbi:MAG TPA: hypothetical protein PLN53_06675 [Terricaulis sp.]|nr:hypothetical protein [Terricaulis sp.]
MSDAATKTDSAPRRREVAHYLSDMSAQLSAMALGAGLKEVAAALLKARDLCEDALERGLN